MSDSEANAVVNEYLENVFGIKLTSDAQQTAALREQYDTYFDEILCPDDGGDGDLHTFDHLVCGVSHYAATSADFIGLTPEQKLKELNERPRLGLFAAKPIRAKTTQGGFISCHSSCIIGRTKSPMSLSTEAAKRTLIIAALEWTNHELRKMNKTPFSLSHRFEIVSAFRKETNKTDRDDEDRNCFIVGSPSTSLFFCANSVDGKNIGKEAVNAIFMWQDISSKYGTAHGLLDCTLKATRDIDKGEEIIIESYGDERADHYFNIYGFTPIPKGE